MGCGCCTRILCQMITPVTSSLSARANEIFYQIGVDMRDLRLRMQRLESCCDASAHVSKSSYQPTGGTEYVFQNHELIRVQTGQVSSRLKRDIKLVPSGEYGQMDMALTETGDLLHDASLETAILMSLFSDRRHDKQRGWWADPLVGRQTGSLLWLLKREKTLTEEHKEGNILRRAEDYAKEALKWLVDSKDALHVIPHARWGDNRTTPRMILQIKIDLPEGSRFALI